MDVKGTVEGKVVDVSRSLVAHGVMSSIRAGNVIETGIARNARLEAGEMAVVRREAMGSKISAPTVLFEPSGSPMVLCGACSISTNRLVMRRVSLRNIVQVDLGGELFAQRERLHIQRDKCKRAVECAQNEIRARMPVLAEKVRGALLVAQPSENAQLRDLLSIIIAVLSGEKTFLGQKAHIEAWCAEYGARHPSVLRQTMGVVRGLEELADARNAFEQVEGHDREIVLAMSLLTVEVVGELSGSGRLVVRCNGKEMEWAADPNRKKTGIHIHLAYDPEEDRMVEMDKKAAISSR